MKSSSNWIRFALLSVAGIGCNAEAAENPAARWLVSVTQSPMDDKPVFSAILVSATTYSAPIRNEVRAGLILRCVEGKPALAINAGHVLDSARYGMVTMRARFDDDPANDIAGSITDDMRSVVLYRPNEILPRISAANRLRVELPLFRSGRPVVEFLTGNLSAHSDAIRSHCGIDVVNP